MLYFYISSSVEWTEKLSSIAHFVRRSLQSLQGTLAMLRHITQALAKITYVQYARQSSTLVIIVEGLLKNTLGQHTGKKPQQVLSARIVLCWYQ